jgi:hypothetical protein
MVAVNSSVSVGIAFAEKNAHRLLLLLLLLLLSADL